MQQNLPLGPARWHRWLLLGAVLCAFMPASQAQEGVDLKQQMPPGLFRQAGLERLSSAELAILQAWLNNRSPESVPGAPAVVAPTVPGAPDPAQEAVSRLGQEQLAEPAEPAGTRIQARIKGRFNGWSGKTLFLLDNGQVWRQRIGGRYRYKADSPEVEIKKGRFGYYLKLLETGRQVGVRRQK